MTTNRVTLQHGRPHKQHVMNLTTPYKRPQYFGQCWECWARFFPVYRCQVYCYGCRSKLVIVDRVKMRGRKR